MPATTQLSPEELAKKKAEIAKQQSEDLDAVMAVETLLHARADQLHAAAFANADIAEGQKPAYADSLHAAATALIAEASGLKLSKAAIDNLLRYVPSEPAALQEQSSAEEPVGTDTTHVA